MLKLKTNYSKDLEVWSELDVDNELAFEVENYDGTVVLFYLGTKELKQLHEHLGKILTTLNDGEL
jgi:hypothetical protein